MKSVRILTRHFIPNYGSLLQSLASVKFFEDLGYEAQIIDYLPKHETALGRVNAFSKKYSNKLVKRIPRWIAKFPDEIIKVGRFEKFRKKYLKQTQRFSSARQLFDYDFQDSYLCSGSDQLWGYVYGKTIDPTYFLPFAKENTVCFAYSSSFGRTDFYDEYYTSLTNNLQKFRFLTIREQSGVQLIHENTPYHAEHVLDPTLSVPREFWHDFADKKTRKKPYMIIYHLRHNKKLENYAKTIAKQNGWKLIRISTSIYDLLKQGQTKLLKDPAVVLSLFKNAQCVVTDSFHATVFSLIFNRPFIDILPPDTHERITDLLKLVGLENRALISSEDMPLDRALQPIDYDRVNAVLDSERERSLGILQRNLASLME
ncbi:MAG: polysaccharide pyruvyl transferase family protein [Clostridia bacterium]|nr:polysaccharide pyruvyl transferase family protein [Clostridia bacterium]